MLALQSSTTSGNKLKPLLAKSFLSDPASVGYHACAYKQPAHTRLGSTVSKSICCDRANVIISMLETNHLGYCVGSEIRPFHEWKLVIDAKYGAQGRGTSKLSHREMQHLSRDRKIEAHKNVYSTER